MPIFLDTGKIEEAKKFMKMGIIRGITTNPTILLKDGVTGGLEGVKQRTIELAELISPYPLSVEVTNNDPKRMLSQAREFAQWAENIVVKIPLIKEGLKAVKILSKEGIKTNVTICFSSIQALMAAKAGATYISPFVGRLDDISQIGMELVEQIVTIYDNYGFDTEVIVASIRNPLHVLDAALIGADIATTPYKVLEQLIKHPLTDIGLENFLADWRKMD